jgi:methylmalonyl-CoA/ethylmalonyl-CoA epimerase
VKDSNQKVSVVLLSTCGRETISVELIAPLTKDSPVCNVLKKGFRLYHLCFEVEDIEKAISNARKHGAIVVSKPSQAELFGGRKIAFVYTRDKYLVEFLEK